MVKLVQVKIFELITCSATGTGMLVKKALTSNDTNVSSPGFTERCLIFCICVCVCLDLNEPNLTYALGIVQKSV